MFVIGRYGVENKDRFATHWNVLGTIFCLMAVDETVGFHEMLSEPFQKLGFDGWLHNAWLIPASGFLAVLAVYFFKFFFHQPKFIRKMFFVSTCLYLGGAVLMEMINGYYAYLFGKQDLFFVALATVEELGEMFEVLVFIHALLSYIRWLGIDKFGIEFEMNN